MRSPATALNWTVRMLGIAGWSLAAVFPYPAAGLINVWSPVPRPDLPPGHPDRLDPSPPTDVERALWAAALSRP